MNWGYRNEYASDLRSSKNFLSSSEKKGLKMIKACREVVFTTTKITSMFFGIHFIKSIFQNHSFLFFSFLLKTLSFDTHSR